MSEAEKGFVVVCDLPNAGECINGVKFEKASGKAFSEPVDEATADRFASIPGYTKTVTKAAAKKPAPAKKAAPAAGSAPESETK